MDVMHDVIKVGIADLASARHPARIRTAGLGSCVGVALYDRRRKIGGLAHVMLPDSKQARGSVKLAKYADTAIPELVRQMEALGAMRWDIVAKLAGGAQMFEHVSSDALKIGERNVEAVRIVLKRLGIPIIGEAVGGRVGRTVELDLEDGTYYVRTAQSEQLKL